MTQNTDTGAPAPPHNTLDDLFGRLRSSGFSRDTDRRWFGGVCSGLAARFGVDPLLIRAAAIILAFAGGIGLTVYLILWLALPDQHGDLLLERALRRGDGWPVVLTVVTTLVIVGGLVSLGQNGGWGGSLWILLPVALVAWFVIERGRSGGSTWPQASTTPPAGPAGAAPGPYPASSDPSHPALVAGTTPTHPGGTAMSAPTTAYPPAGAPTGPASTPPPYGRPYGTPTAPYGATPAPPRPPRPVAPPPPPGPRRRRPSGFVGLISLGLALALFGLGVALDDPLGFPGVAAVLGFAFALAGVSVVALVLGFRGRAGGFTSFLVIALGFLLVTTAGASRVDVTNGVGDRTWVPVASSSTATFNLGAGDATLDLARLQGQLTSTPMKVDARLGAGNLTILVPAGLTARVDGHVGIGEIRVDGGPDSGLQQSGTDRSVSTTIGGASTPDVVVTADVGIGQITIEEN
ncbi:MAG TPA: PspC domain-containing protein [Phycicoccus sp.]|nr:PspC domain-containing protein [Phycicoccus sp.]